MNALLQVAPPEIRLKFIEEVSPRFVIHEVGYGYRPGVSFALSVLTHCLGILLIMALGRSLVVKSVVMLPPRLDISQAEHILILPSLGGGTEGSGRTGGGSGPSGKPSSALPALSRRGFAYPGPQAMISNPPRAILGVQTILQSSIENLPQLHRLLELPNIVQPAPPPAASTREQPVLVVKSGRLPLPRPDPTTVAAPKITVPLEQADKLASLTESRPQLPERATPDPVAASEIPADVNSHSGLLVLNAVPPPPNITGRIPRAEARSLFAVAPAEATVIADPGAGTKAGGSASTTAGNAYRDGVHAGDALADPASGGDAMGRGAAASGTGSGGYYGAGHGSGLDSISNSSGIGRGNGSGAGLGGGASVGTGTGAGAGSAPGNGGFPGITIQGGRYGNNSNLLAKTQTRRQHSYNMSIESTAGSGGGLPDLGVFRDEKVYTVYMDMRSTVEDKMPSWTLQYAVLQPEPTPGDDPPRITGTPMPPYPILKEVPQFDPERTQQYAHGLLAVSAVLSKEGKLGHIFVQQGTDNQITRSLIEALQNWMFEPARIAGQPVALKVLLGIRLRNH